MYSFAESLGDLEPLYRTHYLKSDVRQMCVAIAIWQFPLVALAFSDYHLFSGSPAFAHLLTARFLLLVASFVAIAKLRQVETPANFDRIFLGWAVIAIAVIFFVNSHWIPYFPTNNAIDVLILLSVYVLFPIGLSTRFLIACAFTLGNIVLQLLYTEPTAPESILLMLVTIFTANLLGVFFSSSLNNYRRREFKARLDETKAREELVKLASIDELTGVFNRRKLLELAECEFCIYKRTGQPLTVLMFDIDHFKRLNDRYGHQAGDDMLISFASHIARNIRKTDIWGRVGGEEFVLALPGTDIHQARIVSSCFLIDSAKINSAGGVDQPDITVSIGITAAMPGDNSFADVLIRADKALYRAKRNGRNRIEIA